MRISRATIRTDARRTRARARRGVTLIELLTLCFVLVLVAAIILPRVDAEQSSRQAKALEASIADFPSEAEAEAVELNMPVDIRVVGSTLVMEEEPEDGSASTQIKSIDLGDNMQVVSAQLNGQDVNIGGWLWQAYPNGTTDQGGLGLLEGTQDYALMISDLGLVTWEQGQPPVASDDNWPAGSLDARTQS